MVIFVINVVEGLVSVWDWRPRLVFVKLSMTPPHSLWPQHYLWALALETQPALPPGAGSVLGRAPARNDNAGRLVQNPGDKKCC